MANFLVQLLLNIRLLSTSFTAVNTMFFSLLFAVTCSSSPINNCEVRDLDQRSFQINFNSQIIAIIGWRHPGLNAENRIVKTLMKAELLSKNRSCSEAKTLFEENLLTFINLDKEAQRVRKILIQNQNRITELGTERAFEETAKVLNQTSKMYEIKNNILMNCPHLRSVINRNLNIYPGPENTYAFERNLAVIGVENLTLMQKSIKLIPEELTQIDVFELPLSTKVKRGFISYEQAGFENISKDEFESLISLEPSLEHKRLLRMYRNTIVSLRMGIKDRNRVMIERIGRNGDDHALLIGEDHLADLKQNLISKCMSQKLVIENPKTSSLENTAE